MTVEWTAPKTWTVGERARAADLNTYVRDNTLYHHDPPRCALRLTATQSVANATDHTVSWDEAVWDSHGDMWDVGGPSAITITRAGVYAFNLSIKWAESATGGKRAAYLQKNGTRLRDFHELSADGVSPFASSNTIETNAAVADVFDIDVRQLSTAALNLTATRTVLTVRWVAAPPVSGE